MEPHTDALEIVCKHFKQEYGEEAMVKLRREKNVLPHKTIGCAKRLTYYP